MFIENNIISGMINAFLVIIPIGATVRIIMCAITLTVDDEQRTVMIKRIKNAIAFTVVAECSMGLIQMILGYYQ